MPQVKPVTYKLITTLLQFNLQINLHEKKKKKKWHIFLADCQSSIFFFSVVGLDEHYIS